MRKPQTLKQQWVFERLFHNAGTLASVCTLIRSFATDPSTLPEEKELALGAYDSLRLINVRYNREGSWEKFKALKGG